MNCLAACLSMCYIVSCLAFLFSEHYVLAASMGLWAVMFMAIYIDDRKRSS